MKTALLFPGQGAQQPGMGLQLAQQRPSARQRFEAADAVLGFGLSRIMFEGTAEELQQTRVTQPAIYVHSVVLALELGAAQQAVLAAGHSLGEFSALAAVGALSFEDGLRLVQLRAQAMQDACDATPSTMAAIVGLEDDVVERLCNQVQGLVVPANFNAPGQVVVSGETPAVLALMALAKEQGAKLAKQLAVNGAFHSPLMESARERLAQAVANTAFAAPSLPVVQNVHAQPETDPARLQANLVAQLTAPVRWTATLQYMLAQGVDDWLELGPGNVMAGLAKRVAPAGASIRSLAALPAEA